MWFPKRIPETQCSPRPWFLVLTGLAAPAPAWSGPERNTFLFYLTIKRGKPSLGDFSVTSQLLFALGCGLPAGAWWCFRDLLSYSCLNKNLHLCPDLQAYTFHKLRRITGGLYGKVLILLFWLESVPIHNICCQLTSPSPAAQNCNLLLRLIGSPFGSSSASGLPSVSFHLSYSELCRRSIFKKLPAYSSYPSGWMLEQIKK